MKQFMTIGEWLGLDIELRNKLKEVFVINRSEGMSVRDGKVVSDGCSQGDLIAGITIGKMIEYLGDTSFAINTDDSEKLFDILFKRVLNKVTPIEDVEVVDTPEPVEVQGEEEAIAVDTTGNNQDIVLEEENAMPALSADEPPVDLPQVTNKTNLKEDDKQTKRANTGAKSKSKGAKAKSKGNTKNTKK